MLLSHSVNPAQELLSDSGSTGGLDDRFDMILNLKSCYRYRRDSVYPGSLKPLGNDGNHYNDSIIKTEYCRSGQYR